MKQFIIAIVVLMFSAPAFAVESWTATGTKTVASKATTSTHYMDFKLERLESETLCEAAILAAQLQVMGKGETLTIYADCVKVRAVEAPE